MSSFLAFEYFEIGLGLTVTQMQQLVDGKLTSRGWQQLLQNTTTNISDLIPPVSQTIGNSKYREVLRVYYTGTTITFGSYLVCIATDLPQSFRITAKTGGAVAAACTINGVTITGATGEAGATANENLYALWIALIDSANGTITGWTYDYNGLDIITATCKTTVTAVTTSGNSNVNWVNGDVPVFAGRSGYANITKSYGYPVTVDLVSGCIAYMQINTRSVVMAIKTTSDYYGPIFASWHDNTTSISITPTGGRCSPMELQIGNSSTKMTRYTHNWAIGIIDAHMTQSSGETSAQTDEPGRNFIHPFGCNQWAYGKPSDTMFGLVQGSYILDERPLMYMNQTSVGSLYGISAKKVLSLGTPGYVGDKKEGYATNPQLFMVPDTVFSDVYGWNGTENSEVLTLSRATAELETLPTLTMNLDATTDYASITLSSTTGMPTAGTVIVGNEQIGYTGISGNTITTCTRGRYSSTKQRHTSGTPVAVGLWFTKINSGALCCGPLKPS